MVQVTLHGYYTYNRYTVIGDDGAMSNVVTEIDSNNILTGKGSDRLGMFSISGFLIGEEIRFIKQYTQGNGLISWKYVGRRLNPKGDVYQFCGAWGQNGCQNGQWVLSGVANTQMAAQHPVMGHWEGKYMYDNQPGRQDGPMCMTITMDTKPCMPGTSSIMGSGSDGVGMFTISGTVTSQGWLDVIKTYNNGNASWSWRYEGWFQSTSCVAGKWRQAGCGPAGSGTFVIMKKPQIPTMMAQACMPQGNVIYGVPVNPGNMPTMIDMCCRKCPQVPSGTMMSLSSGFSSMQ